MALKERQDIIFNLLKEQKTLTVKAISKLLYVSEATVRRDLQEMQTLGIVERSHGGARLHENADEISIFFRSQKNAKEKERVASKALLHLPAFRSVFIDSSTTALALAERMDFSYKTVVTNNIQTATKLSQKANVNLILLGGNLQFDSNSVTGSWTMRLLNDFSFDLMICSCAGLNGEEVLERSIEQKEIKRTAFLRSKKRMLLFDHTKWQERGTYFCAHLSDFDVIVTDEAPPIPIPENVSILY